jgi:DNA mismatch endonuclease (patch repair protein)
VNKDRLTKARRSWNMSRIRGKDTTPEKAVRSLLHRMGYRFRLHARITILAKHADPTKPVGRKKAQSAEELSLSSSIEERVGVRSRTLRAASVDILLPKYKTAIFVHGCFWHRHHGCKNATTPSNRRKWWIAKLDGNAARDRLHQAALKKLGWRTVVVWECQTEDPGSLARLAAALTRRNLRQAQRGARFVPAARVSARLPRGRRTR